MIVDLAADIRPLVMMASGRIGFRRDLVGDIAPSITFGGVIGTTFSLRGDIAPEIVFAGEIEVYSATSPVVVDCGTF
jgi:hypothetical protein